MERGLIIAIIIILILIILGYFFYPLCGFERLGSNYEADDGCNSCQCFISGPICTKMRCLDKKFCGTSSYASCIDNNDCRAGGCSGQVCEGRNESAITTCEYRECYNNEFYGVECKCLNNKCQWD